MLRIATRGSFTSAQSQWATAWIRALPTAAQQRLHDLLDHRRTPLFEVVYDGIQGPVIHYNWEGLALLSLMNNETGREAEWSELEALAHAIGCRLPAVYTFGSVVEVVAQQPLLPATFEGFVIRYANGLRVKVKGDQYSELFKAVTGFSARVVFEAMRSEHDEFFVRLPEELRPQADSIREQIQSQITEARTKARALFVAAPTDTRKDFAVWVKANVLPELQWVLFALFDDREPDWYRLVEVSRLSSGNSDEKESVSNGG
jgi:RNA ligase